MTDEELLQKFKELDGRITRVENVVIDHHKMMDIIDKHMETTSQAIKKIMNLIKPMFQPKVPSQ